MSTASAPSLEMPSASFLKMHSTVLELEPAQLVIPGCEDRMTNNHDGGMSFSTTMAYFATSDRKQKEKLARTILRQISVFGTTSTRIDVCAKDLTSHVTDFLATLVSDGFGHLVINEFREAYANSLAPKMTTVIYLLAFMTSIDQKKAGSQQLVNTLRGEAYAAITIIRTASHLLDWVSKHNSLSAESKGTGKGFRNAITKWFFAFNASPTSLALQVTKYFNRNGFTFQDLCRMVHPKTTSVMRCACRGKKECKCPLSNPDTFVNLCSLGVQVVIGYLAQNLERSLTVLIQGISRSKFQEKGLTDEITEAVKTFAFLSAVMNTKNQDVDVETTRELVQTFKLPWEVVNNQKVHEIAIQEAIVFGSPGSVNTDTYNSAVVKQITERVGEFKLDDAQKHALLADVRQLFPYAEVEEKMSFVPSRVVKPITALLRQLNQMDSLFHKHPRSQVYLQLVCAHLQNQSVLMRGQVHPLNVLNTWATYKSGKGLRGCLTWNVNQNIVSALMVAVEKAFYTVEGLGVSIAHLMDRSGSMSWEGSVTGMPSLRAYQIVTVMVLCFLRAEKKLATETKTFVPPYMVGYFGDTNYPTNNLANLTEAERNSCSFCDMTCTIDPDMQYEQAEQKMNSSCSWGATDIGAGIYYLITKLEKVIGALERKDPIYANMSPFELFFNCIIVWTDNDVNSGQQPMIVLAKYRALVERLFHLLPFGKDGKQQDPVYLAKLHTPKMIVVATQGTTATIGDPNDPTVLTVSGFDLSFPTIVKTFLSN